MYPLLPLFIWGLVFGEALFVVSQKWVPFPTALIALIRNFDHFEARFGCDL